MTIGEPIGDAEIILHKKPGGHPTGSARKNKDGSFAFDNVPVGTYTLTFDVPKLSPSLAGKVEYLVIVQQVLVGGAGSSTAKNYNESRSNTSRIPVAKVKDGFDLTVGPQPQGGAINVAKSNIRNSPLRTDAQTSGRIGDKQHSTIHESSWKDSPR